MAQASEMVAAAEAELERRQSVGPEVQDHVEDVDSDDITNDRTFVSRASPGGTYSSEDQSSVTESRLGTSRISTPRKQTGSLSSEARKEQLINTLRKRVTEIGREALIVRVMKGDYQDGGEYRFPDPELLQTLYKLDNNCKPPVYRLQNIR